MTPLVKPADAATRARLAALADRRLTPEEFAAALAVPLGPEERDEKRALIAWFRRRYPTPAARLAYVRQAWVRWTRGGA